MVGERACAFNPGRREIRAKVLNLLDSRGNDIAYYYEAYIRGFDVVPVEGGLSHVIEPRTLRVGAKIRF